MIGKLRFYDKNEVNKKIEIVKLFHNDENDDDRRYVVENYHNNIEFEMQNIIMNEIIFMIEYIFESYLILKRNYIHYIFSEIMVKNCKYIENVTIFYSHYIDDIYITCINKIEIMNNKENYLLSIVNYLYYNEAVKKELKYNLLKQIFCEDILNIIFSFI